MVARLATLGAAFAVAVQANKPAAGPVVHVEPYTKYQGYDGIGVSEAFQRSLVLHELNTPSQKYALDLLFSNKTGAGLTILRNGLGDAPIEVFDQMLSIAPTAPASNSSEVRFEIWDSSASRQVLTSRCSSTLSLSRVRTSTKSGSLSRLWPEVSSTSTPMRGVLMAT